MKKKLFILTISLLLVANLFAQRGSIAHKDSAFKRKVILEVNPALLIGVTGENEFGVYAQIPINNYVVILAGGGLNVYYSGFGTGNINMSYGYSIRTGVSYFFNKKSYISIQLMYRKWITQFDNVSYYAEGFNNGILNPYDGIFNTPQTSSGLYGDGRPYPYDVDNVIMTSYGIDIVYGRQIPLFRAKHLIFEYYAGAGVRLNSYSIEKFGRYDDYLNVQDQIQYRPLTTPAFSSEMIGYFDMKLGFLIGYKF